MRMLALEIIQKIKSTNGNLFFDKLQEEFLLDIMAIIYAGSHLQLSQEERTDHTSIDYLELTARQSNALKNGGENIHTIGQLKRYSDAELLRIPNFGRISLRITKEAISTYDKTRGVG